MCKKRYPKSSLPTPKRFARRSFLKFESTWTDKLPQLFDAAVLQPTAILPSHIAAAVVRDLDPFLKERSKREQQALMGDFWTLVMGGTVEHRRYHRLLLGFVRAVLGTLAARGGGLDRSLEWYYDERGWVEPDEYNDPQCDREEFYREYYFFEGRWERWVSYVRFAALLCKNRVLDCGAVLAGAMHGALQGKASPGSFPNGGVLTLEQVVEVLGEELWKNEVVWTEKKLGEKAWVEKWMEWEGVLRSIIGDSRREEEVRKSAENTVKMMMEIRKKHGVL